ncbi:MAG: hypothetical protein ACOYLP_08515 [Flavobacterium sp.]|uniref:hypothetical protein n=1 Tax=Flavobacterium sp. TaxID=239 RepID=UPI003BBEA92C
MINKRKASSEINKEILKNQLNLIQYKNTTIFENDSLFVLSPSVQNKQKWFDIREVNIIKVKKNKKAYLIIRYFNQFIVIDLYEFIELMICDCKSNNSKNSGIHWKFVINNNCIINKKSKSQIIIKILDKQELISQKL